MNWEAIGAVGEVAGAIAVVLSLMYLAHQVRTSNKLARAGAWRQPTSDLNSLNAAFAIDPVFRRALSRAYFEEAERSAFEPDEAMALDLYLVSITNLYEQLFREVREGVLDDRAMKDFGAQNLLKTAYYQSSWEVYRPNFGPSFVEYFESNFMVPTHTA
jgi:hypothetical protein